MRPSSRKIALPKILYGEGKGAFYLITAPSCDIYYMDTGRYYTLLFNDPSMELTNQSAFARRLVCMGRASERSSHHRLTFYGFHSNLFMVMMIMSACVRVHRACVLPMLLSRGGRAPRLCARGTLQRREHRVASPALLIYRPSAHRETGQSSAELPTRQVDVD